MILPEKGIRYMDFYEILQDIMDEKGLNIPDVARSCGLSDGTVRSMITRKSKNVTLEVAFKMADGLGVSLERLNGLTEHKESSAPRMSGAEDEKMDISELTNMLIESGFVKDGQDLSDNDLHFLLSVGEILRSWFAKYQQ